LASTVHARPLGRRGASGAHKRYDDSMAVNSAAPWASGPGEILQHGLSLLRSDSDVNRRLAMIAIDNAVELTIKTYLGLPKRITGLTISRKEFAEIAESFPSLLDAIEKYAQDKLAGVSLGEIEWYHRLRNQLYHQGNGLTVERDKVEVYAELANVLFKNLFGFELLHSAKGSQQLLGEFMELWVQLEAGLVSMAHDHSLAGAQGRNAMWAAEHLHGDLMSTENKKEFQELRQLRNQVVHGKADHRTAITPAVIARLKVLLEQYKEE
jgi:hypothetical protein